MQNNIEIIAAEWIDIGRLVNNEGQIPDVPKNPRTIEPEDFENLKRSITEDPDFLGIRELAAYPMEDGTLVVLDGNQRLKACRELGFRQVPVKVLRKDTPAKKLRSYVAKDNVQNGKWDDSLLLQDWDADELADWGVELEEITPPSGDQSTKAGLEKYKGIEEGSLRGRFIIPPFTILDTRQGYWVERKRLWKELIQDHGESRQNTLSTNAVGAGSHNNGVSILDPVLAEIICLWFGVSGGKAFDTFAGDTIFGYVASKSGMSFTGIELREEQAALNNSRTRDIGLPAEYINDDGQNVLQHFDLESQDLLFSCPPYFDLEVYSDKPNDASNQETYEDFLKILENAFTGAIKALKPNRFAVIVVGDVRDKHGFYYGFPDDIKRIFRANGCPLYNDIILVEQVGTLGLRVQNSMRNRKVGKCHQNVMVFYKGDPATIKEIYPDFDISNEELQEIVKKFDKSSENEGTDLE